jgi:hypothetical protein
MYITPDNFSKLVSERSDTPDVAAGLNDILRESKGTAQIVVAESEQIFRISATITSLAEHLWVDAGCVSKLITATTFLSACGADKESLSRRVVDVLDIEAPQWFCAITVEDLLNHTHGIDVDFWSEIKRTSDGMLDVATLLRGMSATPLSPTGMYSYSSIGPRLLAAIVEKKVGVQFLEVARQIMGSLFESSSGYEGFCPAMGGRTNVNVEQLLLQLVRLTTYAKKLVDRNVRLGPAYVHNYPGWHPFEKGICVGWKAYSNGWFGHVSANTVKRLCVRVSPSDARGILISSTGIFPQQVLTKLFSETLIGRSNRLPTKSVGMRSLDQCIGVYTRGNYRLRISIAGADMRLEAKQLGNSNELVSGLRTHTAKLSLMRGSSVFAVTPSSTPFLLQVVEFVLDSKGIVTHLWNGTFLWRKLTEADMLLGREVWESPDSPDTVLT